MLLQVILKVALKSLISNRLRSFLAMLGIIIGVTSVISMIALGEGAQKQVMEKVTSMGANLIIVRARPPRNAKGVRSGDSEKLTLEDAETLLERIPNIEKLSPVVQGNGQFKYQNKNTKAAILGAATTYFSIRNFELEKGRFFYENDENSLAHVAVIGGDTADELFEEEEPIGKIIKIDGINFRIIGVLKKKGSQGWFNPDEQAVIPYTVAMKQILGVTYLREIDIQIKENTTHTGIQAKIETILKKRHEIKEDEENDFHIRNMAEMVETAQGFTKMFTVLLGAVAAISLLVGGIGIMNIMLVTVTERTREIGTRKAIGAKDRDVLIQFLIESVFLSGVGGVFGVLAGAGIAMTISHYTDFQTVVKLYGVVLALGFSTFVGVFFGFYPAYRASKLDPIEALSYE